MYSIINTILKDLLQWGITLELLGVRNEKRGCGNSPLNQVGVSPPSMMKWAWLVKERRDMGDKYAIDHTIKDNHPFKTC